MGEHDRLWPAALRVHADPARVTRRCDGARTISVCVSASSPSPRSTLASLLGWQWAAANAEAPQTGEVYALYVSARHQGLGLGRRLVQAVAAELAGFGCLAANAPARRFYEAIGGRLAGARLFDENGILLPEVIYAWADIWAFVAAEEPQRSERQPA